MLSTILTILLSTTGVFTTDVVFEYKFERRYFKWDDAEKRCVNWGGHLVTIWSKELNNYLGNELKKRNIISSWIGLTNRTQDGFKWIDPLQPSSYFNWRPTELNGQISEDCVELIPGVKCKRDWKEKWNDRTCNAASPSICQKPRDTPYTYKSVQPKKGQVLAVIPLIPKVHQVQFSIKPTGFIQGWTSVLHFTTGGNCCYKGFRIPGIFLNLNKLHITGNVNGKGNFVFDSAPIPLNQWTQVSITHSKNGSTYWYAVEIQNEVVKIQNMNPATFVNVKVYATDPWYRPFMGAISNLTISFATSNTPSYFYESVHLNKGRVFATIPVIPKVYEVRFSVKLTGFVRGWSSVLHFTTGANCCNLGSRIPGIFLNWDKLHISGSVNGKGNNYVDSAPIPKNDWTQVRIAQTKVNSKYLYAVYVNGKLLTKVVQRTLADYKNVKVYATDPWYAPFKGAIANLAVFI